MPPPHRSARRRNPVPGRRARGLLAACAAIGFAAALPLAAPAPLTARAAAATTADSQPTGTPPVSVAINSVTPGYASPGTTVTVRGTVTNASAVPVAGLSIQLRSSSQAFRSRDALQNFAAGSGTAIVAVPGAIAPIRHPLAPRATVNWSIKLPVKRLRITGFGVYPLAADALSSSGATLDASHTFLPYWPGRPAIGPLPIAWVWPLIDQPRQSACPGQDGAGSLVNDGLTASLTGSGRLAGLLAAGASYAAKTHLTWALDPALLANVRTMTSPYLVSSNGQCRGVTKPASRAASTWLAGLESATRGQPVFLTPYADVDAVALVHEGLNGDLTNAFTAGRSVAGQILGRDFAPEKGVSADDSDVLNGLSWPPDGVADYTTLQSLAGVDGISSVILDSSTMPPLDSTLPWTPSAQTSTPDGEGPDLHVLLADHAITTLLGSASSAPRTAAAAFAVRQYYLAETAMIAAEAPSLARSVVVVPPSRWDPPASLARALLAETASAPWLRPVGVSQLVAAKSAPGQVSHKLAVPAKALRAGLRRSYLRRVRQLDRRIQLLQSIEARPGPSLGYAIAAAESAAWAGRGAAARPGIQLLNSITSYVSAQESGLTLVTPGRVTLGGLKGSVPVSISNHLGYPVRVRLQVSMPRNGTLSVRSQPGVVKVAAGTVMTLKLAVSTAAVGSTTLHLSLLSPAGLALNSAPVTMVVQATHYGTLALVIIAAALGVFMLTSATRAIRRGRDGRDGRDAAAHQQAGPGQAPATDGEGGSDLQPAPGHPPKADNVESGRAEARGPAEADDPEDADEYARSPGRADRH
jgi:Family of unknown function (DUF6049)